MGIWLNMQSADGTERPFPVNTPRLIIGRDTRCDVRIALPTVAPRHCEIAIEGALVTITDLGSTIGTLHNGNPVERAVLEPGDKITIGRVTFVIRVEPAAEADATIGGRDGAPQDDARPLRIERRNASANELDADVEAV